MTKYIDGLNQIVTGCARVGADRGRGVYLEPAASFAQLTLFPRAWRRFLSHARPGRKAGTG